MYYNMYMSLETNQILWKYKNSSNFRNNPKIALLIATNNQINTSIYKRLIIEGTGLSIYYGGTHKSYLYYFDSKMSVKSNIVLPMANEYYMTNTPLGILGEVDKSSTMNKIIIPFTSGVTRYLGIQLFIGIFIDGVVPPDTDFTITRIYFE